MKMGMVLGGRPTRKRNQPAKKKRGKKKPVKVALKVKGTVDQVHSAVQKLAAGPDAAAKGFGSANPDLPQDKI